MKNFSGNTLLSASVRRGAVSWLVAGSLVVGGGAWAEEAALSLQRTQELDLTAGWNAVFLEVEPMDPEPAVVFKGVPVDVAANYTPGATVAQDFVTDPQVSLSRSRGWGVWYAAERPEAFLGTLGAVYGRQPYLLHAKRACHWSLRGKVLPCSVTWRSDAFNLVGFGVKSAGAPSFGEFFADSAAHRGQAIYRLADGAWRKVLQPDAEAMKSGEAFWIFSKGPSDWQGPLVVELPQKSGLALQNGQTGTLTLKNAGSHPVTADLHGMGDGGSVAPLPVSALVTIYGDTAQPVKAAPVLLNAGDWKQPLPPLEAGKGLALPLRARTDEMTASTQGVLLKISTDMGTETWIPIYGTRPDLAK